MKLSMFLWVTCALVAFCSISLGQTSAFTYQGSLKDGANPANGAYDLQFRLWDITNPIAGPITLDDVQVTNGIFSVNLDFGSSALTGADRYLEIGVRPGVSTGAFTLLAPKQQIASSPYSIQTIRAQTADNALALGGTAANQYVQTTDTRLSDARPPTAGSTNYIQNSTSQQAASNFNVSGNGTVGGTLSGNIVNSAFEYRIGGQTFLNSVGTNTTLGVESGAANLGLSNTFSGYRAGQSATSNASNNSFFGSRAGRLNSAGTDNSFFGNNSGELNSTGGFNAFFGSNAGAANSAGNRNSFFGVTAGRDNSLGSDNSFFGTAAGQANQSGNNNSFFGNVTGTGTTTGSNNSFFGRAAGNVNVSGTFNTAIGDGANFGSGNLTFATSVGSGAIASASNSVVLGRAADSVQIPGNLNVAGTITGNLPANSPNYIQNSTTTQAASNFNISGTGTANILTASTQFNIGTNRILSNTGDFNLFAGVDAGLANTGTNNAFFGNGGGKANTTGGNNSFFGGFSGFRNTTGSGNTFVGRAAGENNLTGIGNSYFGEFAGWTRTGNYNSVFGSTGVTVLDGSGDYNSFFGHQAGSKTTGNLNTFIGMGSGNQNLTGSSNTFVGRNSGDANTTGSFNTVLGEFANLSATNLTNATAIGTKALVGQSNSLVLGSINGVNNANADTNVGIGTTTPNFRFHVRANGQDGIKIQHTGTGGFPQIRWTDSNDVFKASIGVDTIGPGSMNMFVNGADRLILRSNGVVQVPGPLFVNNPNTVIITSPNGACWGISVSNTGVLSTFPVTPCP